MTFKLISSQYPFERQASSLNNYKSSRSFDKLVAAHYKNIFNIERVVPGDGSADKSGIGLMENTFYGSSNIDDSIEAFYPIIFSWMNLLP